MPPRNRKEQMRPVSWAGYLSDEAKQADASYRAHLIALGLIDAPWEPPPLPWYVIAVHDLEVKGET